jgi:undecaprenyl diphosphate synthase
LSFDGTHSHGASPDAGTGASDDGCAGNGHSGLHVAVIMDGNGRWATRRGLPRVFGHRAGANVVRRLVEAAPDLGVGTLTLYAFSADNWRRPVNEVDTLMRLFEEHLEAESPRLVANGVRLSVIGRRDRLSRDLLDAVGAAEEATAAGATLHLRVAVDYSARDAIWRAAQLSAESGEALSREDFTQRLAAAIHSSQPVPDVDLLIRTGGERRLSDFLLWECAYAELHFTDRMWPDFSVKDLEAALREFRSRERRFGGLTAAVGLGK